MPLPPTTEDATHVQSALPTAHLEAQKRKKKKRSREDRPESNTENREKKKKRPRTTDGLYNANAEQSRKKKKNKNKELVVQQQNEDNDSDIDANAQASTAALLNAIVAAVSNATPPENAATPQSFVPPPILPPHLPPQAPFIGFPIPFGQFPDGLTPPPNAFPNAVLGDIACGSNDDILRALQSMDVSKLPGAMKPFGDAADSVNISAFASPPCLVTPRRPAHAAPPPVGQLPVGSSTILNVPHNTAARHVAHSVAASDPQQLDNHAHILTTKWLNTRKLAELVESEGLVYKKGKFSAIEERQLKDAIEAHKTGRSLSDQDVLDIIFPKNEKNKDTAFWSEITKAVPQRPIVAVYHHVRRTYHPLKQKGAWLSPEDGKLKQAVAELGQQWEKVSLLVGRMASDCRDRYRNHIQDREHRVSGAWSKEEEEELTRIVTDMTIKQGRDIDNDVFWSRVSALMGGRRGRQQCRIKWTDSLSKLVKNEGTKPRWSHQDAYILVHKVDSLNVNDDTEIDWKTLPDPDWNLWSAHTLQRRWLTMKKSIKGFEEMSHQDIVDILRVKKSHLPNPIPSPTGVSKRKSRKIISATTIQDENTHGSRIPETSSSTGPGVLDREGDSSDDSDDSVDS